MTAIEMERDLTQLLHALVAGDTERILSVAREHVQRGDSPEVLLGRVGMLAAHGDSDGHPILTINAAAMLERLLLWIPKPLDETVDTTERPLPLFAHGLLAAASAVRTGNDVQAEYPTPEYPSDLPEESSVDATLAEAVRNDDALRIERLLLGLYGTGADYRALQIRAYETVATTFQNDGHPLVFAVRGLQLLDAVEWGNQVPNIVQWLAPHLTVQPEAEQPDWISEVQQFASDPAHNLTSVRTRLGAPRDENALPLRELLLSDASTTQICQGVYDALITNGASSKAIAAVIALTAAEVLQKVNDDDRSLFVDVAHGLLYASAAHRAFKQVQEVSLLPLLFTSAVYINNLNKEVVARQVPAHETPRTVTSGGGGGLIAAAQLDTLDEQLRAQDYAGALSTTHRYLTLNHDARALFGVIGIAAALTDPQSDEGHTLQIVQAASDEYLAWPQSLVGTSHEVFLQIALRAALFGQRSR